MPGLVLSLPVLIWVNNCLVLVALILYVVMKFPRLCCAALRDNNTKQYTVQSSLSPPESEMSSAALPTTVVQYTARYKPDPVCNKFLASEIFPGLPLELVRNIRDFVGPRRISLTDGRYRTLYEEYRKRKSSRLTSGIRDDFSWGITVWLRRKNVDGQIINHTMMLFSRTNVDVVPHEHNITFIFWNANETYDPYTSVHYRIE